MNILDTYQRHQKGIKHFLTEEQYKLCKNKKAYYDSKARQIKHRNTGEAFIPVLPENSPASRMLDESFTERFDWHYNHYLLADEIIYADTIELAFICYLGQKPSGIFQVYFDLFEMLWWTDKHFLKHTIEEWKIEPDWFYYFHKKFRQVDCFTLPEFKKETNNSYGAKLDMIMWNTIYSDTNKELHRFMEAFFDIELNN